MQYLVIVNHYDYSPLELFENKEEAIKWIEKFLLYTNNQIGMEEKIRVFTVREEIKIKVIERIKSVEI